MRDYKIHTDVLEALGNAFIGGKTIMEACESAGINHMTLFQHRKASEDFNEWVIEMRSRGEEIRKKRTEEKRQRTRDLMNWLNRGK